MSHLQVCPHGSYLDATVGGGGHTIALLDAGAGQVVALDQDPAALTAASSRIQEWLQTRSQPEGQVIFQHCNFAQFNPAHSGLFLFDGVIADLGVSSPQLDRAERGFSFRLDGPLDMRMDPTAETTAADWVNHADAATLVTIFSDYGEERYAKRIVKRILERRPLQTTTQLAQVVAAAVPGRGRIHPATRVFQALRIAVNQELQVLETLLQKAPDWLKPGGRLAIISFHSLEDRQVKWQFRQDPRLRVVTPKPIQADPAEVASNPRARSAKLRVAERVDPDKLKVEWSQ